MSEASPLGAPLASSQRRKRRSKQSSAKKPLHTEMDENFIDEDEFNARLAVNSEKDLRRQLRKERKAFDASSALNSQIGQVMVATRSVAKGEKRRVAGNERGWHTESRDDSGMLIRIETAPLQLSIEEEKLEKAFTMEKKKSKLRNMMAKFKIDEDALEAKKDQHPKEHRVSIADNGENSLAGVKVFESDIIDCPADISRSTIKASTIDLRRGEPAVYLEGRSKFVRVEPEDDDRNVNVASGGIKGDLKRLLIQKQTRLAFMGLLYLSSGALTGIALLQLFLINSFTAWPEFFQVYTAVIKFMIYFVDVNTAACASLTLWTCYMEVAMARERSKAPNLWIKSLSFASFMIAYICCLVGFKFEIYLSRQYDALGSAFGVNSALEAKLASWSPTFKTQCAFIVMGFLLMVFGQWQDAMALSHLSPAVNIDVELSESKKEITDKTPLKSSDGSRSSGIK